MIIGLKYSFEQTNPAGREFSRWEWQKHPRKVPRFIKSHVILLHFAENSSCNWMQFFSELQELFKEERKLFLWLVGAKTLQNVIFCLNLAP